MPYQIKKINGKYRLYKKSKDKYVNVQYKTRQSAINAGMNFMRYRGEIPILVGNRIVSKKK